MISFAKFGIVLIFMSVAGCDYLKEAQNKYDNYEGRPETVNVQALDAVGYNGTAVRKTVDKVLDMNDQKQQELDPSFNGIRKVYPLGLNKVLK